LGLKVKSGLKNPEFKITVDVGMMVNIGAFSVAQYSVYLTKLKIYKAKDEAATEVPGPEMANWQEVAV
jgi:hypothetical protein